MFRSWEPFFLLMVFSIIFQGYFAMMEMAIVSYNRVRLQYYIGKKDKKAIWLGKLLQRPTYLFGTTLIGVNFFMQLGSESARHVYANLGLNPDFALATQIVLVLILAELTPLFAARAYPEHIVKLGIAPIYYLSKVLIPFIWVLDGICRFIDWIIRSPKAAGNYLSREELQKAIEAKETKTVTEGEEEFDTLIQAVFSIKTKTPNELMTPLKDVPIVSYESTVKEVKELLMKQYVPFLPLFYKKAENIFGILYTRDLLKLGDTILVREIARSPWFITDKNSLFQILKQFRWNNQPLAIVLDDNGSAIGTLTLDAMIHEIFPPKIAEESRLKEHRMIIDRSFPAHFRVSLLKRDYHLKLPSKKNETLEDLMTRILGHSPQKGESVQVGDFELTLEEVPFLADKTIRISSL